MGLDMFLSARIFLAEWRNEGDDAKIKALNEMFGIKNPEHNYTAQEIIFSVGHWRKAYAIHDWFASKCHIGAYDCKEYPVDRGQLKELVSICKDISDKLEHGGVLHPSQESFIYGMSGYDENDNSIKYTVDMLERVLTDPALEHANFIYQASW